MNATLISNHLPLFLTLFYKNYKTTQQKDFFSFAHCFKQNVANVAQSPDTGFLQKHTPNWPLACYFSQYFLQYLSGQFFSDTMSPLKRVQGAPGAQHPQVWCGVSAVWHRCRSSQSWAADQEARPRLRWTSWKWCLFTGKCSVCGIVFLPVCIKVVEKIKTIHVPELLNRWILLLEHF